MSDDRQLGRPDEELQSAWRLLMGLVLEQRWRWSELASDLNLTQAGLRALLAVDPDQPRPMRDLARALDCDASYVTAMVDDLERAGYAKRQSLSSDRRVKTVSLTPMGKVALDRVRRELFALPAEFCRLTGPERRELGRILTVALRDEPPDTHSGR